MRLNMNLKRMTVAVFSVWTLLIADIQARADKTAGTAGLQNSPAPGRNTVEKEARRRVRAQDHQGNRGNWSEKHLFYWERAH